jgi:hypothetical protein
VLSTLLNDLVRKNHVMPVDEIDSSEEKNNLEPIEYRIG